MPKGGYLARVVKDTEAADRRMKHEPARITAEFTYDARGNPRVSRDAKGRETHYDFDALNRLVRLVSRTGYEAEIRYDANGNVVESELAFERNVMDSRKGCADSAHSTIRTLVESDDLDELARACRVRARALGSWPHRRSGANSRSFASAS